MIELVFLDSKDEVVTKVEITSEIFETLKESARVENTSFEEYVTNSIRKRLTSQRDELA